MSQTIDPTKSRDNSPLVYNIRTESPVNNEGVSALGISNEMTTSENDPFLSFLKKHKRKTDQYSLRSNQRIKEWVNKLKLDEKDLGAMKSKSKQSGSYITAIVFDNSQFDSQSP